jgi:hypothetical protein
VEDLVAWLLTGAVLLVFVITAVTGLSVHGREAERVELETRSTSQTSAVLLQDVRVVAGDHGERMPARARARWTDGDGREHAGVVVVTRSQPAGAEVDVWIDAAGEITSPPVRPLNAIFGGIVAAIGVLCAGATLLIATWLAVRGVTGRCNSRRWEDEWARVEPQWRRTVL